jgi:5-methylcytosine-specific restriction endonuclease McrBC GTP-binding regulatory subunit McrB
MNLEELIEKAKTFEFDEEEIQRGLTLRDSFVKRFPLENLKNMTLQEYAGDKDSFCYWLEFKKEIPFGIGGGSASKFGIYRSKDGNYYKSLKNKKVLLENENLEKEFTDLKNKLLSIIDFAQNDEIDKISEIDIPVWNMVIIKILFLYFPDKFFDFAADWVINPIVNDIELKTDYENNKKNVLFLNYYIREYLSSIEPFRNWDIFHIGKFLWYTYAFEDEEGGDDNGNEEDDNQPHYWKIGTGKEGHLWNEFLQKNEITIGFGPLPNLEQFKTKEELGSFIKEHDEIAKDPQKGFKTDEIWNFKNIKIGDKIIANQGISKILGIGEITSNYFYYETYDEYKHRFSVKWIKKIPLDVKLKKEWAWKTVDEITEEQFDMLMKGISPWEEPNEPVIYTKKQALAELFIEEAELDAITNTLKYKKNIILQGAPGVGKTFIAKRIAYLMMGEKDESRVQMIQFHQSYSYEDFIQGYRPTDNGCFEIKNGVFYEFCKKAQGNPDKEYFFIIDEINRGNLSKIFGELMMLIEKDKRGKDFAIPLTYSRNDDEKFYLPENLYFIGTMNTADRSLAMVDYALRRRFGFITLEPAFGKEKFKAYLKEKNVPKELIEKINDKMVEINKVIKNDDKNLGEGYRIGHSYFCPDDKTDKNPDKEWFNHIIKNEILPLLKEYWFDDSNKAEEQLKQFE